MIATNRSVLMTLFFSVIASAQPQWSGYKYQIKNDCEVLTYEVRLVSLSKFTDKATLSVRYAAKENSNQNFSVDKVHFEKSLNIFKNCESQKLGKWDVVETKFGLLPACKVQVLSNTLFLESTFWYIQGLWVPVKTIHRYDYHRKIGQQEEVIELF